MRWLLIFAGLLLGGCSSAIYDLPVGYAPDQSDAPDQANTIQGANEVKLEGLVEISSVRAAYPLGPNPFVLCIRGISSLTKVESHYAVFFKKGQYVTTLAAVTVDACEAQIFEPLGTAPLQTH